jgi:alpha-amylase
MKRRIPLIVLLLAILPALLLPSCGKRDGGGISDAYRNYYEIFVRSFYDVSGDGVGDLDGVTAKLGYITENLGADGIWLMPVMPSPSYHKYDVTDYEAIDPAYGSLADFDELVAEAHKRDVKILIDLVLNHTSKLHPWFTEAVKALSDGKESPYIGYYNFTTENPGAGYSRITDKYYYECRFTPDMPDLNLDNADLRNEIENIARFWLGRGVDGFRLDAVTSYYTGNDGKNIEFLIWLNQAVKAIKPDAYLVGEAWTNSGTIAEYYKSGIDSFFNFPYSQQDGLLAEAVNSQSGGRFTSSLAEWDTQIRSINVIAIDALFLSNHDQARSAGFLMRKPEKEKMAASLYLLAPGNPFIYYGEEIGMTGSGNDPNKRLPFLWSVTGKTGIAYEPPGSTQVIEGLAGADQQIKDKTSLLNFYKKILAIKGRHPEIARGTMSAIDAGNPGVALFATTWQDRTVYVIHNLTGEQVQIKMNIENIGKLKIADYLAAISGKPRLSGGELTLPPMSTAIIR